MSGPDLHVFTLKFLALKKWVFHVFGVKKKLYKKGITQLFSADAIVFFGSIFFFFPIFLKLLIIGPDPFIPQSSPIEFSYYEMSGPDICSLICDSTQGIKFTFINIVE